LNSTETSKRRRKNEVLQSNPVGVGAICFFSVQSVQSQGGAADVLHMYTALDTNEAKVYIEAFTKDTKINVEWVKLPAGELLTRLKAESKNPRSASGLAAQLRVIAGKKEGFLLPISHPSVLLSSKQI